jgi:cytochrome P450
MTSTSQRTTPLAPGALPLLGHLLPLVWKPVEFLQSLRAQGDIVIIKIGTKDVYVMNSPEDINRILVRQADDFTRGRVFVKARAMLGNGLLTSDAEYHHRQRRLMLPAFHTDRIRAYSEVMRSKVSFLVDSWEDGQSISIQSAMHAITCPTTSTALFSYSVEDSTRLQVVELIETFVRGMVWRTVAPDFLGRLPTPGNVRFQRARTGLRAIVARIIENYRRNSEDHGDLLSMLIQARDEESGALMSPEQLSDEIMALLVAGTETATSTLSWLFFEITRNPEIYDKIRTEVDSIIGDGSVSYDSLRDLQYTNNCLYESLRLYTPNWIIMRQAAEAVEFPGGRLPKGCELLYSPTAMHRDPNLFPNPEHFDPGRWDQSAPKGSFIPFGAGRHKCIGDYFAMAEMMTIVATIFQKWRLTPIDGQNVKMLHYAVQRPSRQDFVVSRW